MSYANFIPTVWNEGIMRELERLCVFSEDCNRQYEGDVKKIDKYKHTVVMTDQTIIPIEQISNIEGEMFEE